jgi:hypothetical protein
MPWSDVPLAYGILSYTGSDVMRFTSDQAPQTIDIVVRPNPPEDDLDSHWSISVGPLPPVVDVGSDLAATNGPMRLQYSMRADRNQK